MGSASTASESAWDALLRITPSAIALFGQDRRLDRYNALFISLWALDEPWLRTRPLLEEILDNLGRKGTLPVGSEFTQLRDALVAFSCHNASDVPFGQDIHLPDGRDIRIKAMNAARNGFHRDSEHKIVGMALVSDDLSAHLDLQRTLKRTNAVRTHVLESLHEAIIVIATDGKLTLHNHAFEEMMNGINNPHPTPPATPLALAVGGQSMQDIFTALTRDGGEEWTAVYRTLEQVRHTREKQHLTITTRTKQDAQTFSVILTPLPDRSVMISFLDITQEEQVRTAIAESAEAVRRSSQSRLRLVSDMADLIGNGMTNVSGYAEALLMEWCGTLNERQADYARIIRNSCHQQMGVVEDIFDLINLEIKDKALTPETVDVHGLMLDVLNGAEPVRQEKNLQWILNIAPQLPPASLDRKRCRRMLAMLVDTVLSCAPKRGGYARITLEEKDGTITLEIASNGLAFPAHTTGFAPVHSQSPRAELSRGNAHILGFTLARYIIDLHHGSIHMKSDPRHGNRITVHLPCTQPAPSRTRFQAQGGLFGDTDS